MSMTKTEVKEQNRTLRSRKKNRKLMSKLPPILGRTLILRPSWLLARVKRVNNQKVGNNKSNYQRTLIEEDEIVILQGLIDFRVDKGKSLYEDEMGFYIFVIRSLNNEVSFYQLTEKVNFLKNKYMKKWKNGVKKPSFRKSHDKKCFELAKIIWGSEDGSFKAHWFEKSFLVHELARSGMSEDSVKERWNLESTETKERIEEKLRVLQAKEIQFEIDILKEKAYILKEVASAMLETVNS
ncbi:hypothetical protein AALP_AA1G102400 [Arabis alpina]|uniref:Uncharacterized protein n=1 Tax=Arabis alpina TaxID=50452 RepID=A0A087HMB9_ARAAL|nr:hypothetical protein AALP_AA1G102400 [Arabis alpina]